MAKDIGEMIKTEAVKRANDYTTYAPGHPDCEVKPLRFKDLIPAIITCLFLIGLLMYGVWGVFPRYFPS